MTLHALAVRDTTDGGPVEVEVRMPPQRIRNAKYPQMAHEALAILALHGRQRGIQVSYSPEVDDPEYSVVLHGIEDLQATGPPSQVVDLEDEPGVVMDYGDRLEGATGRVCP